MKKIITLTLAAVIATLGVTMAASQFRKVEDQSKCGIGQKCNHCNGTGFRPNSNQQCTWCSGSGKDSAY